MKDETKLANFEGESIYVGMDVHKKDWKVSIFWGGAEHKTFCMNPSPQELHRYLKRHFPGGEYYCAYEAGFSGFWIQRSLTTQGVNCIVVNPADIPTTDKEKKWKDDRRDSRKIARGLMSGTLEAIYVPDLELEEDRALVRARHRLVKDRSRIKNRIKHHLLRFGVEIPAGLNKTYWTKEFEQWLSELELSSPSGTVALRIHLQEFQAVKAQIAESEKFFRKLADSPRYAENVRLLRSIPSVGLITAMVVLTEIGDIRRFSNLSQLCAFVGLVPNTHSSGEKERTGPMTKRGNRFLKHILVEIAWSAIRLDPALGKAYKKFTRRMQGNKAIIRITRKLLSRMRMVLLKGEEYKIGLLG